jgi:hypothetical protein
MAVLTNSQQEPPSAVLGSPTLGQNVKSTFFKQRSFSLVQYFYEAESGDLSWAKGSATHSFSKALVRICREYRVQGNGLIDVLCSFVQW